MTKILVIEDEEPVRANIVEMLEAEGFEAMEAENGVVGARLARERLPDLILCDIMMPDLDGYEVLNTLRQEAVTAAIPFIFLTARADRSDLRQGMDLGADDYLTKPFTRSEILKAISSRLAKQAAVTQKIQAKLDDLRGSIALALPHELRTPLMGITGYAGILAQECASLQPQEIQEIAQSINQSARRLRSLIQNFLLYAELEIAARDPVYAHALLGDESCLVKSAVTGAAIQQAQQAQRRADLSLELEDAAVQMAEQYLVKLAQELLSNAFKFSRAGRPVSVVGRLDGRAYSLSLQDHGRGMTAEQIADVGAYLQFERKRHEQQGQGLGLSIAKRLAELNGGKLCIESVYGQQTTVRVVLPAA